MDKNWLCATQRYTDEMGCSNIRLNEAKMKKAERTLDESRNALMKQNKEISNIISKT